METKHNIKININNIDILIVHCYILGLIIIIQHLYSPEYQLNVLVEYLKMQILTALLPLLSSFSSARSSLSENYFILPLLFCHYYFAIIILPLLFCHYYFAIIILPLLFCHYYFAII